MNLNRILACFVLVALLIVTSVVVASCGDAATPTPTKAAAVASPTAAAAATKAPATTTSVAPTATTAAKPTTAAQVTSTSTTTSTASAGALTVSGLVDKTVVFSLDDIKKMKVEKITAEHPKKGKQEYTGVRLSAILDAAKIKADAKSVVLTASDGFKAEVTLAAIKAAPDCMLSLEADGTLSSVMPGMESSNWVKNLNKIEIK